MYCQKCKKRTNCRQICGKLSRHLEKLERYPRESPMSPALIAQIYDNAEEPASSTEWASALDEIGLWQFISNLPRPTQKIIIGYFWKGQSFPVLARNMRISVSQVRRLFHSGLSGLKKRILAKNQLKKIFLASAKKGD